MAFLALSVRFSLESIDKSYSVLAHKTREIIGGEMASQIYMAIWGVL